MYPVYLITNQINSKLYVGVVTKEGKTIYDRFKEHCSGVIKSYLYRAIKKYGKDNFTIELIACGDTPKQALELEKQWIKRLGTFGGGYNLHEGGVGGAQTDAGVLQRMVAAAKSTWTDPEYKAIHSQKIRQRCQDPLWRKQQSAVLTAYYAAHPETIEKMRKSKLGGIPWNRGNTCDWPSRIFARGVTQTVEEWGLQQQIPKSVISSRLSAGWAPEDAVLTPIGGKVKRIKVGGERLTLTEWSTRSGVKAGTINERLRLSWNPKDAVFTPTGTHCRYLECRGETLKISEWSKRSGVASNAIRLRLHKGWDVESAIFKAAKKKQEKLDAKTKGICSE